MTPYTVSRWDALIMAFLCWAIACAFAVEKMIRDGVTSYALLLAMPVLAFAAGLLLHEAWVRLCRYNVVAFVIFGSLALAAMAVTLPISIGNSASSTDLSIAQIQKATEDHSRLLNDLAKANKAVAQAEGWVTRFCKSISSDNCKEARSDLELRKARAADLTAQLTAEKPATGTESGDKRIAWVLNLVGFTATKDDVALGWPILPPAIAEILSAVFLAMGLGSRSSVPVHVPVPQLALTSEERVSLPPPGGTKSKQEALADLLTLIAMGEKPPSQDWLASRFGVAKSTVSKWITEWEAADLVSRSSIGKCNTVEYA